MKYEVRGVLAAAYSGRGRRGRWSNLEGRALLTHVVVLNDAGRAVKVLCRGVDLDHMCDQVEEGPPSCARCAERLGRALAREKKANEGERIV